MSYSVHISVISWLFLEMYLKSRISPAQTKPTNLAIKSAPIHELRISPSLSLLAPPPLVPEEATDTTCVRTGPAGLGQQLQWCPSAPLSVVRRPSGGRQAVSRGTRTLLHLTRSSRVCSLLAQSYTNSWESYTEEDKIAVTCWHETQLGRAPCMFAFSTYLLIISLLKEGIKRNCSPPENM